MPVGCSARVAGIVPVDLRELAAIFLGGVAGALARAGVVEALPVEPGAWPWATFFVNIAGACLLGALMTWAHERAAVVPEHLPPLLGTGFCGALTTFSALQLEVLRLLDGGDVALAALYALVSVAAGLAAVTLAGGLVRRLEMPA